MTSGRYILLVKEASADLVDTDTCDTQHSLAHMRCETKGESDDMSAAWRCCVGLLGYWALSAVQF